MTAGPTVQEELARLRQRECQIHDELALEKDIMKANPRSPAALRRWVQLCETRADCLKAIGELALAPGSDLEPPEAQSGGEEESGA